MKFTDREIQALKPKAERYEVREKGHRDGLAIRVSKTTKTWVFVYVFADRRRRLTLGNYPAMTLAEAHEVHAKAYADVKRGIDPGAVAAASKRAAHTAAEATRSAETVQDLAAEFIRRYSKPRKKTWAEDERVLKVDVLPAWGSWKAKDVTRRDVIALVESIVNRGSPSAANATLKVVRKMLGWAVDVELLATSPCIRIPQPAKEEPGSHVLTDDEIAKLARSLEAAHSHDRVAQALRLMLCTGQRGGEIAGLRWEELDLEQRVWTLPASKAKNGRMHRVPLNEPALRVLEAARATLPPGEATGLVFPGRKGEQLFRCSMSAWTKRHAPTLGIAEFCPHDLRRSAATGLATLGVDLEVISHVLNHAPRGITRQVYVLYSYYPKMREALDAWGRHLDGLSAGRRERSRA